MAHNLENNNGKVSFIQGNTEIHSLPWHRKGIAVDGFLTSKDAIEGANMGWEVEKHPHYRKEGEIFVPSETSFYTARKDNGHVLGEVGSGYELLQNTEAFDFFDNIVGKGEAFYETAGVLGNGERVFITATLPDRFNVKIDRAGKDWVKPYLFLTNSHDGKGCVTAAFTPVRIVCNNTLNAAMHNKANAVSLRHTKNMKEKLNAAHKMLGIIDQYKKEMASIFPAMAQTKITDKEFSLIIASAFAANEKALKEFQIGGETSAQLKNSVNRVLEYAAINETQKMNSTKSTVWGAYNAVTGYFQNVAEYNSESDKINQIIDGNVANKVQTVFNLAMTFVKN